MKNFEKYEDEIRKFKDGNFCEEFVMPHVLKKDDCAGIYCSACAKRQLMWFLEECKEPEIDWSKVKVDTPILVKYSEKGMWIRRKFAKFEDGVVYAWHGKETGRSKSYMTPWNYAKLAESERKDNISESNADN